MFGCADRESKNSSKLAWAHVVEENVSQSVDTLGLFNSIVDSIENLEIDHAYLYAVGADTLLKQRRKQRCEEVINLDNTLNKIEVFPMNNVFIISIQNNCDGFYGEGRTLYFTNSTGEILGSDTLLGGKYFLGDIEILDFDKNGVDELIHTLRMPASSVNAGNEITTFYALNKSFSLERIFSFVSADWDYTPTNNGKYDSISQYWLFIPPNKLKITKEKWWNNRWANRYSKESILRSKEIRVMTIPTLKKVTKPLMISDSKLHHIFPKTLDSIHDSSKGYYLYEYNHNGGIIIKNKSDSEDVELRSIEILGLYSKINGLTKNYLQIGFTCGGPCTGKSFVFLNEDRESETYFYSEVAENNKDIVTHIQNESFDSLWIRNLQNSKEIKVKILEELTIENYLHALKSIRQKGNFLYFYMVFQNDPPLKRKVDIREIVL